MITVLWALVASSSEPSEPAPPAPSKALVAVVHPATPAVGDAIQVRDLRRRYLGTLKFWPKGGGPVILTVLPPEAPASAAFYEQVVGMPVTRFEGVWARLELSGQGVKPREVADLDSLLSVVAGTPGALGYAFAADVAGAAGAEGVKILRIDK